MKLLEFTKPGMTPLNTMDDRKALAGIYAAKHSLNISLVCAVIEQESSWIPWAYRYEPLFFTHYVQPLVNNGTVHNISEAHMRSASWGLMQVMGQTAREAGFTGKIPSLCDPDVGVDVGCQVLAAKLTHAAGDIRRALLLWNGGGNLAYPDEVADKIRKYA